MEPGWTKSYDSHHWLISFTELRLISSEGQGCLIFLRTSTAQTTFCQYFIHIFHVIWKVSSEQAFHFSLKMGAIFTGKKSVITNHMPLWPILQLKGTICKLKKESAFYLEGYLWNTWIVTLSWLAPLILYLGIAIGRLGSRQNHFTFHE